MLRAALFLLALPLMAQTAVVRDLIRQFDHSDLVGLGEIHGSHADQDLRIQIIHEKSFAKKVRNIVVECGNSLYQDDLDSFVRGDDIPLEGVQRVWRNTTQVFAGDISLTICQRLIEEVRAANRGLPANQKMRVIAADPPIDWDKVQSKQEFRAFLGRRTDAAAEVIEREVLRKHEKALLVFGAGAFWRHMQMKREGGYVPAFPNIATLLDRDFSGSLYAVTPVVGGNARGLRRLKGTSLGGQDPNQVLPASASILLGAPLRPPFQQFADGVRLADVVDAVLYRGPAANSLVAADPSFAADRVYAAELERRRRFAP